MTQLLSQDVLLTCSATEMEKDCLEGNVPFKVRSWGRISVVEGVPGTHEVLGLVPGTTNKGEIPCTVLLSAAMVISFIGNLHTDVKVSPSNTSLIKPMDQRVVPVLMIST